ncbi:MAG: response regulator transcription factor [Nitrospirales bacterium]|nr:response regulator transcription factor [Nitrospirales bacterium]
MMMNNGSPEILLIDDDTDILRVLKANLELNRFSVTTADSWAEGQKAIAGRMPNLIILDLMLPDGNGIEICRTVKGKHPDLPIIMLTAKDTISDKVIGLESGADDYMVKPFETLELIARINACLRRLNAAGRQEMLNIGNMNIDLRRRLVRIKGREIILTPKEYDLLCFLVENRGSVISREDIKKHLWKDSKIYSWSRVIDVHIQHLRHKIESNPSEPEYITTISGIGYRFRE